MDSKRVDPIQLAWMVNQMDSKRVDPIQLAWMVNQMDSYKPEAAAPSTFLSREPPHKAAVPRTGTLFLGAVA